MRTEILMLATMPAQPAFAVWMLPHLLLIVAPPIAIWLWRRGGRFSIKHVFFAVTGVAMLGNNIAWAVKAAMKIGPMDLINFQAKRSWFTWLTVFFVSLGFSIWLHLRLRNSGTSDQTELAVRNVLPNPVEQNLHHQRLGGKQQ